MIMTAAFLPAGYWLMKRLDHFLTHHIALPTEETEKVPLDVALFAEETLLRTLVPGLKEAHISVESIQSDDDLCGRQYKLMGALGDDDLQNLLVCSLGKKRMPHCIILAKNNNPLYRNLYRDAGAKCLDRSELTVERIIEELHPSRSEMNRQEDPGC